MLLLTTPIHGKPYWKCLPIPFKVVGVDDLELSVSATGTISGETRLTCSKILKSCSISWTHWTNWSELLSHLKYPNWLSPLTTLMLILHRNRVYRDHFEESFWSFRYIFTLSVSDFPVRISYDNSKTAPWFSDPTYHIGWKMHTEHSLENADNFVP